MAVEIERKFLVRDESWRGLFTRKQEIRDGLIAVANGRKVRVRICDQRATLAVKSKTESLANAEFEYEIPRADAEELITHHCLHAEVALPDWVGREVTGNPDYKKIDMVNARMAAASRVA